MNNSKRLASTLLKSAGPNTTLVRHGSAYYNGLARRLTKNWTPSIATYGATMFGLMVYFTDWRVITDYIPFYNGKYAEQEQR